LLLSKYLLKLLLSNPLRCRLYLLLRDKACLILNSLSSELSLRNSNSLLNWGRLTVLSHKP